MKKQIGDESPLVAKSLFIFSTSTETPSKSVKTSLGRIARPIWLAQLVMFHYEV